MALEVQLNPGSFNCSTCTIRHCDETNPAPFPNQWEIKSPVIIDGSPLKIPFNTCPKLQTDPGANQVISLFSHFKHGNLPDAGGILDQLSPLMEAFEVIDFHLRSKADAKRR